MNLPARAPRMLAAAAVVVAFALRLPVGPVPPGLYHDEAYYGLDAVAVLAGAPALYFPANHGREALFIHLAALPIRVLGRTPAALRLASAVVGTLTVAAAFAAVAALAGRNAGLVAAWLFAVAPWPVLLGRTGFRAGTLPLLLALAVAATWRTRRDPGWRWSAAGGALAGLTLHTYTAARVLPLFWAAAAGWLAFTGWRPDRRRALAWLSAAALVALPLLAYFAAHPADLTGRLAAVAIGTEAGPGGADPAAALAANAVRTAGLLAFRGDDIPRHNIPGRPLFAPPAGLLALVGLAWALARSRREPGLGLLLIWLAVLALPTLLAADAPHFLRAVGLLPAVLALPALGATALATWVAGRWPHRAAATWALAVTLAIAGEGLATAGYLRLLPGAGAAGAGALGYAFEAGATELARDVNSARGRGWRGGWAVGRDLAGRPVWLDRRLRDGWAAVPYLVPEGDVRLVDHYDPVLQEPGVAYLLPEELEEDGLWSALAPGLRLEVAQGSRIRGDLEAQDRLLYVRVAGEPAPAHGPPLARFANGLDLVEAPVTVAWDGRSLRVDTVWAARAAPGANASALVQVLDGERVLAADDAPLGSGILPSRHWRPGHELAESRTLALPEAFDPARHRLVVGLWVPPGPDPVPVVGPDGTVVGDRVMLR